MLLPSNRLIGAPILSLQTGASLASSSDVIIDPRSLHVTAFYCEGKLLDSQPAILHTSDIRESSTMGFIVDSADSIMPPNDLVRLQEIIDFQFKLPGIKVVDDRGKKLGTVSDFLTNSLDFLIQKIYVKRPLFKRVSASDLIIDRAQIVDVTNEKITVKSPTVTVEAPTQTANAGLSFENPFRNGNPQPEIADRSDRE